MTQSPEEKADKYNKNDDAILVKSLFGRDLLEVMEDFILAGYCMHSECSYGMKYVCNMSVDSRERFVHPCRYIYS